MTFSYFNKILGACALIVLTLSILIIIYGIAMVIITCLLFIGFMGIMLINLPDKEGKDKN